MFYKDQLNTTLAEAIEGAIDKPPHEQLQLFEELALMRHTAGKAVKLYSIASEGSVEVQIAAGEVLKEALKEVGSLCEQASRVHHAGKDRFSIHNLMHIVNEITRIIYEEFGVEELERAKAIEIKIRERVKLADESGTTLTPDEDVTEMDDTVPRAPNMVDEVDDEEGTGSIPGGD